MRNGWVLSWEQMQGLGLRCLRKPPHSVYEDGHPMVDERGCSIVSNVPGRECLVQVDGVVLRVAELRERAVLFVREAVLA